VLNTDTSQPALKVVAELQSILQQEPNDPIALLRLGSAHERAGDFQKALAAYEKALRINPRSVAAIVALAQLYTEKLQNQQKALDMAQTARNLAPDDAYVIEMLGMLAYKARDYPWALTLLQQSNERRPGQPGTLYYLGLFYFNLGKLKQAQESIEEALKISPTFAQADAARRFLSFIELCSSADKAAEAETMINETLRAEPEYVPALLASGLVQQKKGKFAEARQIYEKILARNPQLAPAAKQLGILYAEQFNEEQKATQLLAKVREASPEDMDVSRVLGVLAYKRGDFVWSAQLLKESVAGQIKTNASSVYYLGMAQFRLGQRNDSRESLRQALALNEQDKLAPEARKILAELK
jgi:tetratricopeptide (TPR) repeat protein